MKKLMLLAPLVAFVVGGILTHPTYQTAEPTPMGHLDRVAVER